MEDQLEQVYPEDDGSQKALREFPGQTGTSAEALVDLQNKELT